LHSLILWCITEQQNIGFFVTDGWKNERVVECMDMMSKIGVLNDTKWTEAILKTAGYTWTDSMILHEVLTRSDSTLLLLALYIVSMEGSRYDLLVKDHNGKRRSEHDRFIDSLSCFTVYWKVCSAMFREIGIESFADTTNMMEKIAAWCESNFIHSDRMTRAVKSFRFLIGCIPCDTRKVFTECIQNQDLEDVFPTIARMSRIYAEVLPHRDATLRMEPSETSRFVRYTSSYKPLLKDFLIRFEHDYSGVVMSPDYVPARILVLSGSDPNAEQQGLPYTFTAVYQLV